MLKNSTENVNALRAEAKEKRKRKRGAAVSIEERLAERRKKADLAGSPAGKRTKPGPKEGGTAAGAAVAGGTAADAMNTGAAAATDSAQPSAASSSVAVSPVTADATTPTAARASVGSGGVASPKRKVAWNESSQSYEPVPAEDPWSSLRDPGGPGAAVATAGAVASSAAVGSAATANGIGKAASKPAQAAAEPATAASTVATGNATTAGGTAAATAAAKSSKAKPKPSPNRTAAVPKPQPSTKVPANDPWQKKFDSGHAQEYWWNPTTATSVWIHPITGLFPDGRKPAGASPKKPKAAVKRAAGGTNEAVKKKPRVKKAGTPLRLVALPDVLDDALATELRFVGEENRQLVLPRAPSAMAGTIFWPVC